MKKVILKESLSSIDGISIYLYTVTLLALAPAPESGSYSKLHRTKKNTRIKVSFLVILCGYFLFLSRPIDHRGAVLSALLRSRNSSQCLSVIHSGDKKGHMEISRTGVHR